MTDYSYQGNHHGLIFDRVGYMSNEQDVVAFYRHCIGWMASCLPVEEIGSMIRSFDRNHVPGPPAEISQEAADILRNKALTLPVAERPEFDRYTGKVCRYYLTPDEARAVCRQWDEYTGEDNRQVLMGRAA